jgi:DNA-binding CsgD family transcriptional regulator
MFGSFCADWLSEGIGYIFQAIGILLISLIIKRKTALIQNKHLLTFVVLADGLTITAAILANTMFTILLFGFIMNIFYGVIAALYLIKLALYIPQQQKGLVFGFAYGMGSIATWFLSLHMNNNFLSSRYCLIVYVVLMGFVIFLNYRNHDEQQSNDVGNSVGFHRPSFILIASVLILLSVVKGLGFYFPLSEAVGGTISLEFSRSFYAIGLIAAGYIGDKSRKLGAISCLAALVFPFISFALNGLEVESLFLWILGYVFFGFFSVYRVVVFCDIAVKKESFIWIAGFGLLFGRIGDAVGSIGGMLLEQNRYLLVSASTVLFVITVFLFFNLYHKLYEPVLSQEQNEEKLLSIFELHYGLSPRECEVFSLMIKGRSNSEIAGDLFISESTVKFHVKNVLKKTACENRTGLIMKFRENTL